MKKLAYVLALAMVCTSFTACGDKNNVDGDASWENTTTAPEALTFGVNDFAIYTTDENLQATKFLCMLGLDASTIDYTDETAIRVAESIETETLHVKEGDKENPGTTIEKDVIRYINFTGSHDAITNVRGISTTGLVEDDEKCSEVEKVIAAYGIDTENEAYIDGDVREDGSYTIRLNFSAEDESGSVDRIKSPVGTDLSATTARYSIRFNIINDRVRGLDMYMAY